MPEIKAFSELEKNNGSFNHVVEHEIGLFKHITMTSIRGKGGYLNIKWFLFFSLLNLLFFLLGLDKNDLASCIIDILKQSMRIIAALVFISQKV